MKTESDFWSYRAGTLAAEKQLLAQCAAACFDRLELVR